MKDIKIFISCHKPAKVVESSLIYPVQVGAALTDKRLDGMAYRDNDGEDNISALNRKYCELTAQYFVYKNVEADYYGFFHYRRYLSFSKKYGTITAYLANRIDEHFAEKYNLIDEKIAETVEQYDVIMPKPYWIFITNRFMYKIAPSGFVKDLDFCIDIIRRDYPHMYKIAKKYMRSSMSYTCNMFIMKKEIFKNYCEWLFDILKKFDEAVDCSGYNSVQGRVSGYLAERLLGVYYYWLKSLKKYKIKTLSRVFVKNTDPQ